MLHVLYVFESRMSRMKSLSFARVIARASTRMWLCKVIWIPKDLDNGYPCQQWRHVVRQRVNNPVPLLDSYL